MSVLLNLYDYIFLAFIFFFAFVGLARGFWVQLFAVVVWLAGIAFYYVYGTRFEHGFLSQYMSEGVAHWFSLVAVLVGACIINFIIRFLLGSVFKMNPFTFLNKVSGFILGVCASALILILLIYALNDSALSTQSADWKKSYIVTQVTSVLNSFKDHNDGKISLVNATADTEVPEVSNTETMA